MLVVVLVELKFNALSSPSSTLLPPLFFFLGRTPFNPAHWSPARAIFLGSSRVPYPPRSLLGHTRRSFFARPPESTSPLARRHRKPQWQNRLTRRAAIGIPSPMFSWSRSVVVWTYSAPSVWPHARCLCTVYLSATSRLFPRHPAC